MDCKFQVSLLHSYIKWCLCRINDLYFPGEIQRKGVLVPMSQDIYRPMLTRLKQEGIRAREEIHNV